MPTAPTISPLNLQDPTLLKDVAYVNGLWLGSSERFAVTKVLAEVANLAVSHAAAAITAAQLAFPLWAAKTGKERATLLRRWFDLMSFRMRWRRSVASRNPASAAKARITASRNMSRSNTS